MSEGEKLIKELAEDFSLRRLKDFLFEKDFTEEEREIFIDLRKGDLREKVNSIRQVAYKKLEDVGNFNVYAIELKENITERSSKKRQFEIAKEILKANQLTAGLFVFHPQEGKAFRFSLVFTEPYGTRREYSPYKRYTYFVSPGLPNKTFIKQVGGCEFKDLKEIKSAFSIQPLTKEFYKEIQTWFYHALENYEKEIFFPGGQKEENLIRLITRLMFVWFIKQMGLVPEKLFDPKELKNIVKDFGNGHNYYNAILQNLFFATLNRPINERGWAKDEGFLKNRNTFGIKSLYRYEDKFLITPEEVLGLFENIPFINGGLFECLDKDSQYIDGFSRRPDKQAKVPDKYFFQEKEQETDLSKHGLGKAKFRGLISIFKDYNWTTDESSPIDQEIALDPELLGKVFENLLASYNPETATTARKATGSYYTPKEIVDYMVEESLKEYFKTKTSLSEEKIENLFYQEEPQLSDEEKKKLVQAIADVKIIDPACGSGAFCMGALHKLVELLNKIDPDNKLWKEEQLRRLTNELSERWEEMTQEERNEERAYLLEVFNEQRNYPDYGRKLYLIQNCIYGVDIQPIAVQLTKLRFFLSLILDQKPSNDKDNNFGILPLPHLETKFVCANTLIGLESSRQRSIKSQEVMKIERELKRIRERYFRVRNRKQKQELEEKDRELREKLAELLKKQGWDNKDIQKIISFDILDPTAKADWFDPEWMFGVVDGFDVVIGNPPYIKEYTNRKAFDGLRNSPYYQGKMDIWYLFACKGIDFLKDKGILTFIAQNNWITSYGASKMRNKVVKECKILQLLDFGPYFIFENSNIQTMIMIFQKNPEPIEYSFDLRRIIGKKPVYKDVIDLLNKIPNPNNEYLNPTINRNKFLNKSLTFSKTDIEAVLNKIEEKGKERLHENEITNGIHSHHDKVSKDMLKKLGQGFKVGDGIFVLSDEEKNNLQLTEKELELIKPYYTSKELKKYYGNRKNSEWIIYTDSRFKDPEAIKPYPNIKKHLDKFQAVITSDNKPYGLHRARDERFFKGEKIIALRKCAEPTFTYTDFDCYVSAAFYVIKTNRFNLKYLTGLLNSKLIAFWLRHKGKMQGNIYQIDKEPLLNIPIPPITPQTQPLADQIVQKVQEILTLTQSPDFETSQEKQQKVKELEREIDQLVYKLYGLTEEEIKIIESN
jgi:hypothetical protein